VHEGGYRVRRTDDGLFIFTKPDGKRVEENGMKCFRGNILSPLQWHGESMDYNQAIESMQFLERKALDQNSERPVSETTVASSSAGSTGFVMCA